MYKLDLETINEERLRKSVGAEIFQLGQKLFENAPIHIVQVGDVSATLVVTDKRRCEVELWIARDQIKLKCTCSYGARGLICEHEVAGWLALQQHFVRQLPAPWQEQIKGVIDASGAIPRRAKVPAYYLYFSLHEEMRSVSPYWRLTPYTLALNALPAELRHQEPAPGGDEIADLMTGNPNIGRSLKTPYYALEPEGCLNCSAEAVDLANIILERNRAYNYAYAVSFPLENFLTLLRGTGTPLYLGQGPQPLNRRLLVHSQPGELRLNINRCEDGLHLTTALIPLAQEATEAISSGGSSASSDQESKTNHPEPITNHQPLTTNPNEIDLILTDPYWLLAGENLIKLDNPSGLSLLDFFADKPELVIPTDQAENFAGQYLLDLGRRFPLQGDAIAWEVIHTSPTPRLYLIDQNNELQANLRLAYGEYEVRYDPDFPSRTIQHQSDSLTMVRIERSAEAEKSAYETLSSAAFGLKRAPLNGQPGLFRLRARTHPVDFLLNSVPKLAEAGFEIFGEEQLRTARVNRNTPTISFKVTSGIDWFDVKTVVNFGDLEVALPEVRRALRKHERYIKLADGTIGEIPQEWFERYKHLFAMGEAGEDSLRFSQHHITLLEQALADADRVVADEEFDRRRQRLRKLLDRKLNSDGIDGGNHGELIAARPLPVGFVGELRHYQKEGYNWLHFLREFRFGGCLADDMGLGKTVQTLVFLQSLYEQDGQGDAETRGREDAETRGLRDAETRVQEDAETRGQGDTGTTRLLDYSTTRPHRASLLVVPRSLLVNWQREAERFTPGLRILEFFDTDRVKDVSQFDPFDLVITTYGVLLRDIQLLHGYTFYYAILDESQAIKNPVSQTARAAHLLRADHRLVLTGTPIENSTAELWSQFAFLNPGLLGSMQYFKTEFGLPIEKKNDGNAAESLRKLVSPFILRRTKDQVTPELPPRTEKILYCDMDPAQRKLYLRTRDYYRGVVLGMLDTEGLNVSRIKILEGLLRLRQICNHPQLVDEKFHGGSAKFELLLDTLETLRSENHKALIFSQFVKMLTIVRSEMDVRQMPYTYLDGHTIARQEQVDRFQSNPSIPFFLISLRAGGLGLNLTAADYVIHIDPWWNPAVEMQASDRTHRIGQDKPVFVFKLIARDSVEEKILVLQERKRKLVDQIITTENAFFKSLTREDVEELFG